MFIVLEGMDCTGKSTLGKELRRQLKAKGFNVVHLHEPSGVGVENKALRNLIINSNFTKINKGILALASRAELYVKKIKPALDKGKIVICERNFISSMVYNAEEDMEPVLNLHVTAFEEFNLHLDPDLLVHLEIDHKTFVERINKRGRKLDKIEKSLLVKEQFDYLRDRYGKAIRMATNHTDVVVFKNDSLEDILAKILEEKNKL